MAASTMEEIPGGEEVISQGIPTITRGRATVHCAGYSSHIGCYPGARTMADFEPNRGEFKRAKRAIRFPLSRELPEMLIGERIRSRFGQLEKPE